MYSPPLLHHQLRRALTHCLIICQRVQSYFGHFLPYSEGNNQESNKRWWIFMCRAMHSMHSEPAGHKVKLGRHNCSTLLKSCAHFTPRWALNLIKEIYAQVGLNIRQQIKPTWALFLNFTPIWALKHQILQIFSMLFFFINTESFGVIFMSKTK